MDGLDHFFGIFDCTPQVEPKVLEETDEFIISRNRYGSVMKESRKSCHPSIMVEPGVKDRRDWDLIRDRLKVHRERFNHPEMIEKTSACSRYGRFVTWETIEPLWYVLHNTMGYEHGLYTIEGGGQPLIFM